MNKYYITFGQVHAHSVNGKTFDKDCVAVIETKSMEEAREISFNTFGPKFCFCTEEIPDMSFFPRGLINLK